MASELDAYLSEQQTVEHLRASRSRISEELSKVIVGQADVVEQLLISLFAGGHCLITGAPGLAKTLLVRSIAQIFQLGIKLGVADAIDSGSKLPGEHSGDLLISYLDNVRRRNATEHDRRHHGLMWKRHSGREQ